MNTVVISNTETKRDTTDYFIPAKLLAVLLLVSSIAMYVFNIFTSVTLPACLLFAFMVFLAINQAKKEKISETFTSALIVADLGYIAVLAFMVGRLFIGM